jgi:hypothetical protein
MMWFWAIFGPLAILIGALSFVTDLVNFEGATPNEKLANMGFAAPLGAVGLAFVWLRWRGYLKFAGRD